MEYINRANKIAERIEEPDMIAFVYVSYGLIYSRTKEWDKAIHYFERSIKLAKDADIPYSMAEFHFEFGLMYKGKGEKGKAEVHLREAMEVWKEMNNEEMLEEAETVLEELTQ